jgi:hypothetical protein
MMLAGGSAGISDPGYNQMRTKWERLGKRSVAE